MCEKICCKATAANTHRKIYIPINLLKKNLCKVHSKRVKRIANRDARESIQFVHQYELLSFSYL